MLHPMPDLIETTEGQATANVRWGELTQAMDRPLSRRRASLTQQLFFHLHLSILALKKKL